MEGLPGLDNGPEVYETSDIDSVDGLNNRDSDHHEDINCAPLNAATAQSTFEDVSQRVFVYEDVVDFSGSLDHPELYESGYTVRRHKESREQKLKRIAHELRELQSEDQAESDLFNKCQNDLESLLKNAESGPFSTQVNTLLQDLDKETKALHAESDTGSDSFPKTSETNPDSQVLEIESRINEIERLIGLELLGDRKTLNLHNHIKDLERKVEFIFDPEFEISSIKKQIDSMNSELDALDVRKRVSNAKHGNSDTGDPDAFEKSVIGLYQNLEQMEKYQNSLPHMIARLKTLNHIHLDLAGKTQTIGEFDATLDSMSRDLKNWLDNLQQMNGALEEHEMTVRDNVVYVDQKMAALEKKLSITGKH